VACTAALGCIVCRVCSTAQHVMKWHSPIVVHVVPAHTHSTLYIFIQNCLLMAETLPIRSSYSVPTGNEPIHASARHLAPPKEPPEILLRPAPILPKITPRCLPRTELSTVSSSAISSKMGSQWRSPLQPKPQHGHVTVIWPKKPASSSKTRLTATNFAKVQRQSVQGERQV
jgi:hypothetical protein